MDTNTALQTIAQFEGLTCRQRHTICKVVWVALENESGASCYRDLAHKAEREACLARYEYKELAITRAGRTTFVVVEVGRIGDENTMASIYCRDRRHYVIGPNGGIRRLFRHWNGHGDYRRIRGWRATH